MDLPVFRTVNEDFLMKVELVAEKEIVERVEISQVFSVGEWESEGEEDCLFFVSKLILENTLQFGVLPHDEESLSFQSFPSSIFADFENRTIGFVILGLSGARST